MNNNDDCGLCRVSWCESPLTMRYMTCCNFNAIINIFICTHSHEFFPLFTSFLTLQRSKNCPTISMGRLLFKYVQ